MQLATRPRVSLKRQVESLQREVDRLALRNAQLEAHLRDEIELKHQAIDGLLLWNNLMTHEEYDAKWARK